ncbi:hypothetical protein [Microbacterium marinilacus]|uniref:HAD family phosphatase n=1 Tax=Microbacterium marinilacus TaxID=415209 RepID=A0ABP7B1W8_9MICO|nr:hypothetical protein [Microbacterium marinilacus]MBY0688584.1 hypothetical protein [Microbacterium marinilacus]
MTTPPLGLLLDVDGPLASTVTRSLRVPSIADDLVAIARAGCPVVFNTGRSDAFLAEQVVPVLVAAGLPSDAPVWGIGEKGATWFPVVDGAIGEVQEDDALRVPERLVRACRRIADRHRDLMFWDETKRTMVSLEQNVEADNATYLDRQPAVTAELDAAISDLALGDEFHTVPSIISVDLEHRDAGKAIGASRAVRLVGERMGVPRRWFTAGDSTGDYDMAAWLHDAGYDATHLDVRPDGDQPNTPYAVLREIPTFAEGHAEDDITAAYLAQWRAEVAV